jgi:hypothetical protein
LLVGLAAFHRQHALFCGDCDFKRLGEVLAWIKQQQDKQPHHRGNLVGPRRSNQKAGLMKDRVDARSGHKITSPTRPLGPPPLR